MAATSANSAPINDLGPLRGRFVAFPGTVQQKCVGAMGRAGLARKNRRRRGRGWCWGGWCLGMSAVGKFREFAEFGDALGWWCPRLGLVLPLLAVGWCARAAVGAVGGAMVGWV